MTKKIYVAYTGGTIGMQPTGSGYAPAQNLMTLLSEKLPASVLDRLPEFELHEYDTLIDSSYIRPDNWQQMAQDIAGRYDDFDGFVILHGTDTMAYSSAMLSFMLQNLRKPVIFTGSQVPLCEARSDALDNFTGALTLAACDSIQEVCLYFHGRLLRGNRSRKLNAHWFDAFDSPAYPWLGRADIEIELDHSRLWRPDGAENFLPACAARPHVLPLPLFPGISADWLATALAQPFAAFILGTYGTGNGPDQDPQLLAVLAEASARGKVIVNQSQCLRVRVCQDSYAAGSALAASGLVSGHDMTPEALFCKLHFLFSQGASAETVRRQLALNLCGELTP